MHLTDFLAAAEQLDIEGLKLACGQWDPSGISSTAPAKLLKAGGSDTDVEPDNTNGKNLGSVLHRNWELGSFHCVA